jgi:hypothetical protein
VPVHEGLVDGDSRGWIGSAGSSVVRVASKAAESGTGRFFDFELAGCLPDGADDTLSPTDPASIAKAPLPAASVANTKLPKNMRRMMGLFLWPFGLFGIAKSKRPPEGGPIP